MYIFVTYGYPGMRGVQTKGLRLADYLKKRGYQVKFYDHDPDHSILTQAGFDYIDWNLNALYLAEKIIFPKGTKAIIFCDLPTNYPGQLSLFLAAKSQKIPTVVIDNYYHSGQLSEKVFSNVIQYSDLVILNGLTVPSATKLPPNLKILGPFIRLPKPEDQAGDWRQKFRVKDGEKIILGAGYNEDVLRELKNLSRTIRRKDIVILALGASKTIKRVDNLIYLPFLDDQQVSNLLSVAILAVYKFGFIQVIEALMNSIPVIVTGGMRGFKTEWLDKTFQHLFFEAKNTSEIKKIVYEIADQKGCFIKFQNQLKKINFADKNSLETAARLIEKIRPRKTKSIIREIIISFDDKKSLQRLSDLLIKKPFALPVIFSASPPQERKRDTSPIWQFEPTPKNEILQWGCQLVFRFSSHSFHSSALLLPFYNILIEHLRELLTQADRVSYCNNKTKSFIKPLLN